MFDKFFRHRAINAFLKRRKNCILPDISKYPAVALLMDETQYPKLKSVETLLYRLFLMKRCHFYVIFNELPENVPSNDKVTFITKNDFNFFGKFNGGALSSLTSEHHDFIADMSGRKSELLVEEYVMSVLKTPFRIAFGKSSKALFDLVIDSKSDDMTVKIEALHKYLLMLSGK